MNLRKHQVAIISSAVGIFALTFSVSWFIGTRDIPEPTPDVGLEYSEIKIFFSSTIQDPSSLYCEKTYSVLRSISRPTDNPSSRLGELAYVAIKELLKGPTDSEKSRGFLTSINEDAKVQKISIEEGIVTVDFSALGGSASGGNQSIGGSCRVMAIRSQITETLKQFPEVKEVIISVDGNSEEILQP